MPTDGEDAALFWRPIRKQVDDNGNGTVDRGRSFVYDGSDVILVFDITSAWQHRFLHGAVVDQVFLQENVGEILWGLADNQGTIRDVANYDPLTDTSAVLNHRQFNAFGGITSETNSSIEYRQAYTGGYFDEDTGLLYRWHRWYDAETARWMSEDWILDDTNSYRYVRNSATNLTDPSGLQPPTKELAKKLAEKARQYAALQELLKVTKTWAGRKWIEAQIEYLDTEDSDLLNRRLQAIAPLRRHREISVRAMTRDDIARHRRNEAARREGLMLLHSTADWNVEGQLFHHLGGHDVACGTATAANPNLSPLQRFLGAVQAGTAISPYAVLRKVPQVTANRLAGQAFERQAQKYVRKELGETVIQSQFRRGNADRGFDFLSFTGKGRDARLFINEAKCVSGKVAPRDFRTFGLGKSGRKTFDEALREARKAIQRSKLDGATKRALFNQLERRQARIRLIGSQRKGTVFDPKVNKQIGQSTGYITGEGFLLP